MQMRSRARQARRAYFKIFAFSQHFLPRINALKAFIIDSAMKLSIFWISITLLVVCDASAEIPDKLRDEFRRLAISRLNFAGKRIFLNQKKFQIRLHAETRITERFSSLHGIHCDEL